MTKGTVEGIHFPKDDGHGLHQDLNLRSLSSFCGQDLAGGRGWAKQQFFIVGHPGTVFPNLVLPCL